MDYGRCVVPGDAGAAGMVRMDTPTPVIYADLPGTPQGYMCRTCGRNYKTYSDAVFRHGECECPSIDSWEIDPKTGGSK